MAFESALLSTIPGITYGFGTAKEPVPSKMAAEWPHLKPLWFQVHGTDSARVDGPGQECGQVDALYTATPGQIVAVVTADCVPILLARRDGRKVAAVHAGWRGTKAKILLELWKKISTDGDRPEDWVAAVGPSIGPCCYEVSEELAKDFKAEFPQAADQVVPRHRILDLPEANAHQLRTLGIACEIVRACTRCLVRDGQPVFHSYRRNPDKSRQWSMIRSAV